MLGFQWDAVVLIFVRIVAGWGGMRRDGGGESLMGLRVLWWVVGSRHW